MDDFDAKLQYDGMLRYRREADGTHVGIIPAICKACGGPLHKVGVRARQRDGVMIVDCGRCVDAGLPGHALQFTAHEPAPDRVELDSTPYLSILPTMRP
ncbi:hypothetical protein [Kutzneria buriramensis]|uniref:hypothetical protein n=1 Tax=Kutzneria buriramensis TaxID=1045776 RepID=UPI000E27325F|nr:hypothetical protein [Kutzneria buriramensis]